jgi:hypothetical protein
VDLGSSQTEGPGLVDRAPILGRHIIRDVTKPLYSGLPPRQPASPDLKSREAPNGRSRPAQVGSPHMSHPLGCNPHFSQFLVFDHPISWS